MKYFNKLSKSIIATLLAIIMVAGYGIQIVSASSAEEEIAEESIVEEVVEMTNEEIDAEVEVTAENEMEEENEEQEITQESMAQTFVMSKAAVKEPVGVQVKYFVLRPENAKYRSTSSLGYYVDLGYGTVSETKTIMDNSNTVSDLIEMEPDMEQLSLSGTQEVSWYRLLKVKVENVTEWCLFGEIVGKAAVIEEKPVAEEPEISKPTEVEPEKKPVEEVKPEEKPVVEEPIVEKPVEKEPVGVQVRYLALRPENAKYRSTSSIGYYVDLGYGTVSETKTVMDNKSAVSAMVKSEPGMEQLGLSGTQEISWYRLLKVNVANVTEWCLFGEIVGEAAVIEEKPVVEEPEISKPDEIIPEEEKPVEVVPEEQKEETLKELMYRMIMTGDSGTYDVTKYDVKSTVVYATYSELINGECKIAYNSAYSLLVMPTVVNGKVASIRFNGLDSNFKNRYQKTLDSLDEIMDSVAGMSELETVLWVHDYIVDKAYYKDDKGLSATASGPLALGYGICQGYSNAMMLALGELGIETQYVKSSNMNHAWIMVKVNGEWFHLDATWNRSSKTNWRTLHTYLLRTDAEFKSGLASKHYDWTTAAYTESLNVSTAKTYSKWFVHDVNGRMYYSDGAWYYSWNGDIVKSDINGNNRQILAKGNGSQLMITSFEDGEFTYQTL